ncbi:MAG: penicillin-binding protein activator LpoB [Desulfobacterium sp.]|nr:penicillin-binding protein activator LpoB [Desulfobacterium sp.]
MKSAVLYNRFLNMASICFIVFFCACTTTSVPNLYRDAEMDFASIHTVVVMPFGNLTTDRMASDRVREAFSNKLLSTNAVYVVPSGEVARGIAKAGVTDATIPSTEEIVKIAAIIKADALITGMVSEYGVIKSGATSANVISISLQMIDVQTRKVVWTASSTKGGISVLDRLFGGGGAPMNDVTEAAIDDVINKLFND